MTGALPSFGSALGDVAAPRRACHETAATFEPHWPWELPRFMLMLAIGVATFFFPMAAVFIFGFVFAAVLSLKALARPLRIGGADAIRVCGPASIAGRGRLEIR